MPGIFIDKLAWRSWTPTVVAHSGGLTLTPQSTPAVDKAIFMQHGKLIIVQYAKVFTLGGSADTPIVDISLPVEALYTEQLLYCQLSGELACASINSPSVSNMSFNKADGTNFAVGGSVYVQISGSYAGV